MSPARSALAAFALLALAGHAAAQEPVTPAGPPADTVAAEPARDTAAAAPGIPSPAGAFLRSLIIPGWGQAVYGKHLRGGVYFAAQTGSWFMLAKTLAKLSEAEELRDRRAGVVRDSLLAAAAQDTLLARRIEDPDSLRALVRDDPTVGHYGDLVGARKEQREDWIAWTLFWTFAGALDAFVNAHLADFPAEVAVQPGRQGGVAVGVRVPAGGKP